MKIQIKRIAKKEKYTIGKLYINGEYFCDTIEDKDRGLDQSMSLANIAKLKVKGQTAIPTGTYEILMNVVSQKFYKKQLYREFCGGKIPRLKYVKGFSGVCIHSGVNQDSTEGCPIVGENKMVGMVINSWATFKKFYRVLEPAAKRGEKITLIVS